MSPDALEDEEALGSMLIAWYMSGYHTGYYLVCAASVLFLWFWFCVAVLGRQLDGERWF